MWLSYKRERDDVTCHSRTQTLTYYYLRRETLPQKQTLFYHYLRRERWPQDPQNWTQLTSQETKPLHVTIFRRATQPQRQTLPEPEWGIRHKLEANCDSMCGIKTWRGRSLGAGVYQPEDPEEVKERLLEEKWRRGLLSSESDVWHWESSSKDEDLVVFDMELDCGKAWRGRSLGASVYQRADPWEVGERLLAEKMILLPSQSDVWH